MLKTSLQIRLGQQLTMTPQLQHAIRLLQLPLIDLQAEIRDALDNNLMLEADEPAADAETAEKPQEAESEAPVETDWDGAELGSAPDYSGSRGEAISQDIAPPSGETLAEHLMWQLELDAPTPRCCAIGEAIIDAINDDGYLTVPVAEIRECLRPEVDADVEEIERVLALIQRFDPVGVGARDLSECLLLQLAQYAGETPGLQLARRLVSDHLDLVAERQLATLRRRLGVSEAQLAEAIALMRTCHPRPGAAVHPGETHYIVPDVFVRKVDERWVVEINSAISPRLRVNKHYAGVVSRDGNCAALRTQLQEARWLVRSLEIRNETLLKVATCIVERQRPFLEHGDEAMQPLVLRDVAEALDVHESTVSRVTTNKYMHTPRGVFEFRHFFSSHVAGAGGEEHSSTAIRAMIKRLIGNENPARPLSDSKLALMLGEDGIKVARRTVAKYREAMGLPASNERKRLAP